MSIPFGQLHTRGGYRCDEVTSAMQKAIRRGQEDLAIFWASELDQAGYANYCWKRLRIIASEDVGPADHIAVLLTHSLHAQWMEFHKRGDAMNPLFLIHAVQVLARAKKSRQVDHAVIVYYSGERPHPDIPDEALDKHTGRGRSMGRDLTHFLDVGIHLENHGFEGGHETGDPYYWRMREAALSEPERKKHGFVASRGTTAMGGRTAPYQPAPGQPPTSGQMSLTDQLEQSLRQAREEGPEDGH